MVNFRHEWKHEINSMDAAIIRQRLMAVTKPDSHARELYLPDIFGVPAIKIYAYGIRSLYFDNLADKALREKIDGVNMREKFRIRYYNNDTSAIHLEKKSKYNHLTSKESAVLSKEEVQKILDGDCSFMAGSSDKLVTEFYSKMQAQGLRPKTIVDYTREPFVYGPGNVRVTLDYDIRMGMERAEFLKPESVTIPAGDPVIILEVKWDAFLPDVIRDAVGVVGRRAGAFSKYAACRIYG